MPVRALGRPCPVRGRAWTGPFWGFGGSGRAVGGVGEADEGGYLVAGQVLVLLECVGDGEDGCPVGVEGLVGEVVDVLVVDFLVAEPDVRVDGEEGQPVATGAYFHGNGPFGGPQASLTEPSVGGAFSCGREDGVAVSVGQVARPGDAALVCGDYA